MRGKTGTFEIKNVAVSGMSGEGKALARHEGMVVFVEGAVPGDVADVTVYRKKKNFAEARAVKILNPSPDRVAPLCKHFGTCGGCLWQNIGYGKQLLFKEAAVHDAFTRIGKLDFKEILPILGNNTGYHYRNKLEFTFTGRRWLYPGEMEGGAPVADHSALGFHLPGKFDKVFDIETCYLLPEPCDAIRGGIRDYVKKNQLGCYDIRGRKGFLRNLTIRVSSTGEIMVLISVYEFLEKELFGLLEFIKDKFPFITSLLYVHNDKGNDTLAGLVIKTYYGKAFITDVMGKLRFRISPGSFYQTNSGQAHELYKTVLSFAGLRGDETVYDLYTGAGTIANFIAGQASKVIGIEYSEEAVRDARENSVMNGINNTVFVSGDMKEVLNPDFYSRHGIPQLLITDPPRAGMEEKVVKALLDVSPQKIVYVSCNPATQARDLSLLKHRYSIDKVQPVDMFPQTAHVENVVLLNRNSEI